MIIFGNPASFGIEYARAESRNYIHVRLLLGGGWVGDIAGSLMPESMCRRLLELCRPKVYRRRTFERELTGDELQSLRERGGTSFGESFDGFGLKHYVVLEDARVHFDWQLDKEEYRRFPAFPRQQQHYSVPLSEYKPVVLQFVHEMIRGGYYIVRPDVPDPADVEP